MEQKIIELRKQNLGYKVIANKLGLTRDKVRAICLKNNLGGVKSEIIKTKKIKQDKPKPTVCINCGKNIIHVNKRGPYSKYCSTECRREYDKQTKRQRAENKEYKNTCEYCNSKFNSRNKSTKYCSEECKKKGYYSEEKECKYCGYVFKTTFENRVYCSENCKKKMINLRNNQIGTKRRDEKIKLNGRIDKDITLIKIYNKNNGICAICGDICDYDDYKKTEEGYFIAGEDYPSIDHIIPVSKGGTHTWNNVQLAHRRCNTLKSDGYIEDEGQLRII